MNLGELSRTTDGDSEATFVARHPDPALVFLVSPSSSPRGGAIDTPGSDEPRKSWLGRTVTGVKAHEVAEAELGKTDDGEGQAREERMIAASEVVFLQKSERNPFASMITVGRAPNNDLWLPHGSISKLHAYFTWSIEGWKITDQRSTNGTHLGDVRLPAGGSASLQNGARIGLGPDIRAAFFLPAGFHAFLESFRASTGKPN